MKTKKEIEEIIRDNFEEDTTYELLSIKARKYSWDPKGNYYVIAKIRKKYGLFRFFSVKKVVITEEFVDTEGKHGGYCMYIPILKENYLYSGLLNRFETKRYAKRKILDMLQYDFAHIIKMCPESIYDHREAGQLYPLLPEEMFKKDYFRYEMGDREKETA